jgi:hypothetical protein
VGSFNGWGPATLVLRRTGYNIKLQRREDAVINESYSKNLQVFSLSVRKLVNVRDYSQQDKFIP